MTTYQDITVTSKMRVGSDGSVSNKTVAVTTAAAPTPAPAPTPPPAPSPAPPTAPAIILAPAPNLWLQTGPASAAYWMAEDIWNPGTLTRGAYTGPTGSQFEMQVGVSHTWDTAGGVAARMSWKWPVGTTEVKAYPALLVGAKPGIQNAWICPGGDNIQLLDGSISQVAPSGKTPGTFFPLALPVASLKASHAFQHNTAPTGRGHLSYDIWLQDDPTQQNGFGPHVTHEIMIPLDYWGGYGAYPTGRNPAWYVADATIDGLLWHVYYTDGGVGPWKFIVFEPAAVPIPARTLDLAAFLAFVASKGVITGPAYMVSSELGVETVDGTGDLTVYGHRVWQ